MKASVGSRIVERLQKLADALESGEDLAQQGRLTRVTLDLTPRAYDAARVRQTRGLLQVSQVIFAELLGVAVSTVRAWEQGQNVPSRLAARFLDEIAHNPNYWKERLQSAMKVERLTSYRPRPRKRHAS
jgi:DNA-binding transcriptional regulator YiaG